MTDRRLPRGKVGLGDLARAFVADGPDLQRFVADLLGYDPVEPRPVAALPSQPPPIAPGAGPEIDRPEPTFVPPANIPGIPFWYAGSFKAEPRDPARAKETVERVRIPVPDRPPEKLPFMPLATDASILTAIRSATPARSSSGELDVDRIVERWGRGRFLDALPRRDRKSLGRMIQVIVDRSLRLKPYWDDQDRAVRALRKLYSAAGFSVAVLADGDREPVLCGVENDGVPYSFPPPDSTLLVLGDLGCLAPPDHRLDRFWVDWGRRLLEQEVLPIALVPCQVDSCDRDLANWWTILSWERGVEAGGAGLSELEGKEVVEKVLTLLSFALRIEPQLIRFVRRALENGRRDAGIEAKVWQHAAFLSRHSEAAALLPESAETFREGLSRQSIALRTEVYQRARDYHRAVYSGVWFAELFHLEQEVKHGLIASTEFEEAQGWFASQRSRLVGAENDPEEFDRSRAWHDWILARSLPAAWEGEKGRVLHAIWSIVHRHDTHAVPPSHANPTWLVDPAVNPADRPERLIELVQMSERVVARTVRPEFVGKSNNGSVPDSRRNGSPLALIRTRQGRIKIEPFDEFWEGGAAPAWAESWGRDDFGPWVDLRVEGANQRLRWIPSGTFWMGSPEEEEGRFPHEGPRHEQTIASGFWMFDTPCRQDLWEAVMGENPSYFKGPNRPVECVSWDQCQEFLERLNGRFKGLELKLPSEAQWEYACRAGTNAPRYREDLNEIAWYLDNSKHETHPVGEKAPNDWGLYDTLGNVLEWCEDVWTDDYNTNKKAAASAHRVFRGGSWFDGGARYVRAACRSRVEPSDRYHDLGFRCAEFSAPGPVGREQDEERAGERGAGCGASGDRDQASGAGWINLDAPGMDGVSFAALAPVRVSSDVEQVVLRTTTRPTWASAIGRDRCGLWAEFTIEGKVAKPPTKRAARKKKSAPPGAPLGPVRQRLRWIPPGRFLMGSPPDEDGRYSDEGPQHEVTIAEGFWMFDTPCTQALWEALMCENPSEFRSPHRPVENVSWDDCRKFVETINEKFRVEKAGLSLSLPSEAQWEYACRAGTTTATYAGPLKIEGENNARILDAIAWYGGNSGIDFELSNGWDASKWPEKQFEFDKAGTHPVARKKANPWGLYDMLGNVWEWCKDVWVEDYTEKSRAAASAESAFAVRPHLIVDLNLRRARAAAPVHSASARRMIRGGSWSTDAARRVRAAYRYHRGPSDRLHDLGFRCAEFRQGVVSGAVPRQPVVLGVTSSA